MSFINTAWMLEGAPCWVQVEQEYYRGQIQKLINQRTIAKLILSDNRVIEVSVNQLLRASNSKVIDLTELQHINEPEILFKIKNAVYLDRQVLINKNNISQEDYIQYKKYINERLILNNIPPHIFSTIFYAYQNLDQEKNTQIFITGNKGYGKSSIIYELIQFLNKDLLLNYKLIQSLITDNTGTTRGVINYRIIFKQKRIVGMLIQLCHLDLSDFQSMDYFNKKLDQESFNPELRQLLEQNIQNNIQYQKLIDQVITYINNKIELTENIQIISIFEYPVLNDQLSIYIQEKIEQIYLQMYFKNCQQQLLQDQLKELYNQIKFQDNLQLLEEMEKQNNFPTNIIKLNSLITKDTQLLFIRLLKTKDDLKQFRIFDSISFFKNCFPHRINFIDFYSKFHHLDAFNKKISLQKHLNRNQDMKALTIEICKRLTQSKGIIFGQTQIYFKKEALDNLNKLLCQHNSKLSIFAQIIQKAYKTHQFKKSIFYYVKQIIKNKSIEKGELEQIHQEQLITQLKQSENSLENSKHSDIQKEEEIQIEISDQESYDYFDENQQLKYKEIKIQLIKDKRNCLLKGTIFEEVTEIAQKLLTPEQQNQKKIKLENQKLEQQLQELESIQNDLSDQEAFSFLTFEQKLQYLNMKKQNQQNIAFRLLNQEQQQQVKQLKKSKRIIEFKKKYYDQLEPFLSDLESFKQLNIGQQKVYKIKKMENKTNVAISLLNEQQLQNRIQIIINQRQNYINKKKYMEDDYLSDIESYKLLKNIQIQQYRKEKKKYKNLQLIKNQMKYGYNIQISDEDSYQLLQKNKDQYYQFKYKLQQFNDYSDIEAYLSISDIEQYKLQKQKGIEGSSKELINKDKYIKLMNLRKYAQKRLDELNIINHTLLDSISFKLLDDQEWKLRRQLLEKQIQQKQEKVQIGYFCYQLDSVAYSQLNANQKEKRKEIEKRKQKLKNIINPYLFENLLHPDFSVAFRLLKNKDLVYQKYSLSYSLLKVKNFRNQQLKEFQVYDYELVENLNATKQELLQEKICKYEQEKLHYQKDDFSDYDAFTLLDEDEKLEYKKNAYQLLDDEQKQQHRKMMKQKLIKKDKFSDIESYDLLSDNSKEIYTKLKNEDVSDYYAYQQLSDKEEYKKQKVQQQQLLQQIEKEGYRIFFGTSPQLMTQVEYEKYFQQQQLRLKNIQNEEEQMIKQLQFSEQYRDSNLE